MMITDLYFVIIDLFNTYTFEHKKILIESFLSVESLRT